MSTPFRLGIAGLGTVGAGVVKIAQTHGAALAEKAGRPVEITAVSARNRGLDRGVDLAAYAWEDDVTRLAQRDDVDCVIEAIGGEAARPRRWSNRRWRQEIIGPCMWSPPTRR